MVTCFVAPNVGLVPFWGEVLGISWTTGCNFPVGDKWPPDHLVSASPRLGSLASWLLGASVPAFRQCFSLQLVLFLLLKPLYYLLSLPLLSLFHPFERVDFGQLQHHSSACETCPSSWQWLTLMADKQTWESCFLHRSFIRLSLTGVIEV